MVKHIKKRFIKWTVIISCIILIICGLFLVIFDMLGLFDARSGRHVSFCIVDNRMAFYDFIDSAEKGDFVFEHILHRKGEFFQTIGKYNIYKVKSRDDLVYLIFDDGYNMNYGKFSFYLNENIGSSNEEFREGMKTSAWYESGYLNDENLATLVNEPYTYELVLKTIYNVASASDIKKVKFEKAKADVPNEGEVDVKSVTLRKTDDIKRIYSIFSSLRREIGSVPIEFYEKERKYTESGKLLSKASQLVTITLVGGEKIVFRYSPVAGMLYENGSLYYDYLAEADNDWLIKSVGIDMS